MKSKLDEVVSELNKHRKMAIKELVHSLAALVLLLGGLTILFLSAGWKTALAVWMIIWAINLRRKLD